GPAIPAVAGHRVFLQAGSKLFALSPADGRILWKVGGLSFPVWRNPVVTAGGVYVLSDGALYDFDPATGATLWRSARRGYTNLAVDRTHVFAVSGPDGRFDSFDAATGFKR